MFHAAIMMAVGAAAAAAMALTGGGILASSAVMGEKYVQKHYHFEPNITNCEKRTNSLKEPELLEKMLGRTATLECGLKDGFSITPAHIGEYLDWPYCASPEQRKDFHEYTSAQPWRHVSFSSRKGKEGQKTVKLTSWWLPVESSDAARMVLVHGSNTNFNDYTVQVAAYYLRQMGISCLLVNLRDHGSSEESGHAKIGWGYDYHLDALGAWDYAVNDPDQKLGGRSKPEKVGMMGFGVGGYVTAVALGLEPRLPGAWIDSGVFDGKEILDHLLLLGVGSPMNGMMLDDAWSFANRAAGFNLALHSPARALASSAAKTKRRPVGVTHGQEDPVVPPEHTDKLIAFLEKHSELYEVKEKFLPDSDCKGNLHATTLVQFAKEYREKLEKFWKAVFPEEIVNTTPSASTTVSSVTKATHSEASTKGSPAESGKEGQDTMEGEDKKAVKVDDEKANEEVVTDGEEGTKGVKGFSKSPIDVEDPAQELADWHKADSPAVMHNWTLLAAVCGVAVLAMSCMSMMGIQKSIAKSNGYQPMDPAERAPQPQGP
eukprot:TRINITY_DN65610_c0_g1_i1.p1 TRINITY_DN65610_c0_g1~~TRINITY_DN65610_c0_g1_i1.p1  ORF type:complete len:545 (-),score=126.73 TRINITY_DN65610_c0_g1_i1:386-2020(-)